VPHREALRLADLAAPSPRPVASFRGDTDLFSVLGAEGPSATQRVQTARMASAGDVLSEMHGPLAAAVAAAKINVDLCSPYIGPGTATQLAKAATASPAAWTLLTRLDAVSAAHGSLDIDGLRKLRMAGVALFHEPRVHAKVFLLDDSSGFLGSGNLTDAGLGASGRANLELGVALDPEQCAAAAAALTSWRARATPVTSAMLDKVERDARRLRVPSPRPPTTSVSPDVVDQILAAGRTAKQVWIKGLHLDAVGAAVPPDDWVASRRRPSFAVDDVLLIYAVTAKICNSVVRVTGPPHNDPEFAVAQGKPLKDSEWWSWITPVEQLLHVPVEDGVPLERLGISGRSVQNGHTRMRTGGLAGALR
jgi:hypothetical protein